MDLKTCVSIALLMICGGSASGQTGVLDAKQESHALQNLLLSVRKQITSAARAMPADKYGFAPSEGEFKGVRSFGQQLKHLSATNFMLGTAALGEEPPRDAGDEQGPDTVRTKVEVLAYLDSSFECLRKAVEKIGQSGTPVRVSPISPFNGSAVTRAALVEEALVHAFDHYGQMVVYLRMNGVVPPASVP